MLLLFIVIFLLASIFSGFEAYFDKKYERKKEAIKDMPYDVRSAARAELENSKLTKMKDILKVPGAFAECVGGVSMIGTAIILLVMFFIWSPYINEKIALYEEENAKIESQIAAVVSDYQQYELGIVKECAPESAVTLISLYPELKADTLVNKQIEVYLANNEKIKELKENAIDQRLVGWWFNFNAW